MCSSTVRLREKWNIHNTHTDCSIYCIISCRLAKKESSLVEEDVVLWTHAQRLSYGFHFWTNVLPIYVSRSRGGRKQPGQYGPATVQVHIWEMCPKWQLDGIYVSISSNDKGKDVQSGGLSCPIVTQERSDLILIEVHVERVHCRSWVPGINLHQVLHWHSY